MKSSYDVWMSTYKGEIYRKCVEVTNEMKKVFPELIIVKGLAQIMENEEWYPHQWLIDPVTKEIIDPTERQWKGILEYKELPKTMTKLEKCPNCGHWILNEDFEGLCSEKCEKEYLEYLNACVVTNYDDDDCPEDY